MPSNEDLEKFLSVDIKAMEILLFSKAQRTAISINEFIDLSLLNGADPDQLLKELLKDLNEGGRIFGEFRAAIKATSNGVIKRATDTGQLTYLEDVTGYRWVAVGDKHVCDDCISRHGEVKSYEDWEAVGLPATGHTVCKERCRCVIIPEEVTRIDPITLEEIEKVKA